MAHERTLPLLLLNLGGEMVYILEQRLQAQRVPEEKATKVLVDICRLLLHERFMSELFVPQPLGHVAALRTFFRDLAHSSIMRLDDDSMAKMWDLMTMAVKHQALRADSPLELLQATLNHIEYIGEHVTSVRAQAEQARQGLLAFYSRMPSGELQAVRYSVLNYLQGLAVRVSLYLKHGLQDMQGRLIVPRDGPVPPGCEPPGVVRIMDGAGREVDSVVQVLHFPAGGHFTGPARDAGPGGSTELGCNLYSEYEDAGGAVSVAAARRARRRSSCAGASETAGEAGARAAGAHGRPLHVGREELNMLMAQLLGNRPSPRDVPARLICVSLFNSAGDPEPVSEVSAASAGPSDAHKPSCCPCAPGPRVTSASSSLMSIDASGSAGSRSASLRQVLSDMAAADQGADLSADQGFAESGPTAAGSFMELWDDLSPEDDDDQDTRDGLLAEQEPLL